MYEKQYFTHYETLLDKCKNKVDMILDNTDFTSRLCEAGVIDESGRYTNQKADFIADKHNWTHSFLSGMTALLYYHFKEPRYLEYLEKSYDSYKTKIYNHPDGVGHDTGFLYCLYAVAYYKVTGNPKACELALKAADEFSKRFHWRAGIIQGFGELRDHAPMTIIDDMMNLSLTAFAYGETDHLFFEEIFKTHVQTIMTYLLRDDCTFRHSFAFDDATGKPLGEKNYCGYSNGSVWARGQAWGLHGMVNALAVTKDVERYGYNISGVINKLMEMIPQDGIPLWDMRCVGSHTDRVDTSAAVIIACALEKLKLMKDAPGVSRFYKEEYGQLGSRILQTIAEKYLADETSENIITGGQAGRLSTGCMWGDYFFVELLMLKLHGSDTPNFWA